MDFFGVGMGEIALVLVVAMLIWGPARMVEIARKMGKLTSSLRNATSKITAQVTEELKKQVDDSPPPPDKSSPDTLPPGKGDKQP